MGTGKTWDLQSGVFKRAISWHVTIYYQALGYRLVEVSHYLRCQGQAVKDIPADLQHLRRVNVTRQRIIKMVNTVTQTGYCASNN